MNLQPGFSYPPNLILALTHPSIKTRVYKLGIQPLIKVARQIHLQDKKQHVGFHCRLISGELGLSLPPNLGVRKRNKSAAFGRT